MHSIIFWTCAGWVLTLPTESLQFVHGFYRWMVPGNRFLSNVPFCEDAWLDWSCITCHRVATLPRQSLCIIVQGMSYFKLVLSRFILSGLVVSGLALLFNVDENIDWGCVRVLRNHWKTFLSLLSDCLLFFFTLVCLCHCQCPSCVYLVLCSIVLYSLSIYRFALFLLVQCTVFSWCLWSYVPILSCVFSPEIIVMVSWT